jgi:hypothetical protein
MDRFIASLPKTLLALIVLGIGYALIIYSDPPKTPCDEHLMSFRRSQREFLYGRPSSSEEALPPAVKRLYEKCLTDNSPGGCYEYFERLRKFSIDLRELPKQCAEAVANERQVQGWLFKSMKLMAQIAWGDRGPSSISHKYSWFDSSEVSLFCALKKNAVTNFGQEAVDEWGRATVSELPGTEGIAADLVFQKSLLSASCEGYRQ